MDGTHTISDIVGAAPWSRQIYHDADSFWRESKGLHYAYLIYRTLRGDYKRVFQPDAVFYVGKSPAAYLKKVNTTTISDEDIRRWQRFLWNQAVVPMLVVQSRTKVHVYTAYTPPKKEKSEERIISILENVRDMLELDQLWALIESGMIYEKNPHAFLRSGAVDTELLRNLNYTALQLAETQNGNTKKEKEENLKFAHHFLTRLLFVCNLIERGMIGEHFTKIEHKILYKLQPATENSAGYFLRHLLNDLNKLAQKRDAICRIFRYVKRTFNGSLFPHSIAKESKRYTDPFIKAVDDFLQGHDIETGQRVLGFWAYDFSVIPIETISAVYESFLGEQGKLKEIEVGEDSQRAAGAYYTPLHLAEMVVDTALEDIEKKTGKPIHELEVLDPACGSGVFLVSLFGRMADSLYRETDKTRGISWARELRPKLNQLYGVDISATACHITCFSLYLAFLEWLEPKDIEYLLKHGERLPPLLKLKKGTVKESRNTIQEENFFNSAISLKKRDFDVVIGNPPWVSGKYQKDDLFLTWRSKNPKVLAPNKQIAHGFAWKALEYLSNSGQGCLLLPTAVLFNDGTNEFQKEWFSSVAVERVVNFSDLRFVLFAGAVHPCIAIRFGTLVSKPNDSILYESPKSDILNQKGGPVYIREEDTILLHQKEILHAAQNENAPMIWKSHYWGSWRDYRLTSRLKSLPKLHDLTGKSHNEPMRWDKGTGIMVGKTKNKGSWNSNDLFLDSKQSFSLVISNNDCKTVTEAKLPLKVEAPRRKELFMGPKVLITEGSQDIKVGFCDFTVFFKKSIYVITGPKITQDINYLRFLSIVIKSSVIQYFLFHTSSDWGTERDRIHLYELLSIPFFLPENAPDAKAAQAIVTEVAKKVERFGISLENKNWFTDEQRKRDESDRLRNELDPLIREYYNIDKYESMLIEDTLQLAIKSFHPRQNYVDIPTLQQAEEEECRIYTMTLCEMLNHFGKDSRFKVNGEVFMGSPYSVVHVSLADRISARVPVSKATKELASVIKRMEPLLKNKKGRFIFCQNLKVFDGKSLYLLKPMQMRFWSRTAALNDADEIAGAILSSRGRKHGH
ncbi:MAG: N-6 DNA methylase [Sedimentisphaerales bacterium]|nr:N-6 DNA methylase [Sedimentisphaerales bacterium]